MTKLLMSYRKVIAVFVRIQLKCIRTYTHTCVHFGKNKSFISEPEVIRSKERKYKIRHFWTV